MVFSALLTELAFDESRYSVWQSRLQCAAEEWAGYLDTWYGLPTTPWLVALVERPGWHHYLLRRSRHMVAVRTMYVADGMAWFGIDAPVPGVMAPSYDFDVQLCHAMVRDGLDLRVRLFVADIEAPDAAMTSRAYHHFGMLEFKRPYFRSHYSYRYGCHSPGVPAAR